MNGKIDGKGFLHIERAGKMQLQACPRGYMHSHGDIPCGDWCSLFGEPELQMRAPLNIGPIHTGKTEVRLCDSVLFFIGFKDERGKADA